MEDIDKIVLEPNILGTAITIDEVRSRIQQLQGTPKDQLKTQMASLKHALKINPEIANLLLPEEIGELVKSIYRMTEQVVIQSAAKATAKKAKQLDFKQLKEMPGDF